MAQKKDQTGTKKEVKEQAAKAEAELRKQRKSKFEKKADRKNKQIARIKNITDLDAEKMASSLSFDNIAAMPEGEAPMIQEIRGESEHASEQSPEPEAEKLSKPVLEQSPEPESEKISEPVPEQSPEHDSEKLSEPVPEQFPVFDSEILLESEHASEKPPEPEAEKLSEPPPEQSRELEEEKLLESEHALSLIHI